MTNVIHPRQHPRLQSTRAIVPIRQHRVYGIAVDDVERVEGGDVGGHHPPPDYQAQVVSIASSRRRRGCVVPTSLTMSLGEYQDLEPSDRGIRRIHIRQRQVDRLPGVVQLDPESEGCDRRHVVDGRRLIE